MFERFTDRARTALALAQGEARAMGHDFLGTEHLLLGVAVEGDGVAGRVLAAAGLTADEVRAEVGRRVGPGQATLDDAEALRAIGIDLDEVRAAVEDSFGPGALDRPAKGGWKGWPGRPPVTPRAKKALEYSLREALELGHNYIGTEHLLLGIVRLGEGVAFEILEAGVGPAPTLRGAVRAELKRMRPTA